MLIGEKRLSSLQQKTTTNCSDIRLQIFAYSFTVKTRTFSSLIRKEYTCRTLQNHALWVGQDAHFAPVRNFAYLTLHYEVK